MAHEITEYDEMLSVRAMPWHGLGHVLTDHPTRIEAQSLVHPGEPVTTPMFKLVPSITPEGELRDEFVQRFQPMPADHLITDRVRANVEEARGQLRGIFNSQTQEGISLTAYGLFQAGIEWSQHDRRVRGKDDRTRMESYFRRNMLDTSGLRRATLNLAREVALV